MSDSYHPEHRLKESSDPLAGGPGVVNYDEWSEFYHDVRKKMRKLKEPAKSDIQIMFEQAQHAWLDYSSHSLKYKRHNDSLHRKYQEKKTITEKYITMAFLKGMHF